MPPKKIGYASKRSIGFSSTRPRKHARMKGYSSGVRIMDKSAKILVGVLSSMSNKPNSYNSSAYNLSNSSNTNIDYTKVQNSDSNVKQIIGIIFLVFSALIFISSMVLLIQGYYFISFFTTISTGLFLGPGLYLLGIDVR